MRLSRRLLAKLALVMVIVGLVVLLALPQGVGSAAPAQQTLKRVAITVDGLERFYLLHLPATYSAKTRSALVIVLHGGGGDAEGFAGYSGFIPLSDSNGFIAVFPEGTGNPKVWNAGHCCGSAQRTQVDDVGFIKAMIAELSLTYNVDSRRISVSGMSNGGMMAYRLAAELSDQIAAIGVAAGTIGGQARPLAPKIVIPEPTTAVAVIAFHGKLDQNVTFAGGTGVNTTARRVDLSVADSIAFWVKADGCSTQLAQSISPSGNITVDTYSGCKANTSVVLYSIADQGHAWPGGAARLFKEEKPTQEISAAQLSWEFFVAHPKSP